MTSAGGFSTAGRFKAVQTGGPSGGCLPASLLHLPMEYESLAAAGSIMGSGGLVVLDDTTCIVDLARYFITFTQHESCGKCAPCRLGTTQMLTLQERICAGEAQPADMTALEQLAQAIKSASLCGLGQTAPNPVLTTLRYFKEEYDAHIEDKRCPAGVCTGLISYRIREEQCTGCQLCRRECPQQCISGERKSPHVIDVEACINCGICIERLQVRRCGGKVMTTRADIVEFTIDGMPVSGTGDETVLQVARRHGVYIPTLCYLEGLEAYGGCRLCLVEIAGMRGLNTACTVKIAPGMRVQTTTPEIDSARKITFELLLADHPMECLVCARNQRCEFQEVAAFLGIREVRYPKTREPLPLDTSNPFFIRDNNKCILCGRCVRTCHDLQGVGGIGFINRGSMSLIGTSNDVPLVETNCESCGECVVRCPTGALTNRMRCRRRSG